MLKASSVFAVLLLASCVTGVSPKEAAKAYYDLGNAYSQLGQPDKASNAYIQALQLDNTLFQASYNLARVYIEMGQYAKGTALLNELLAKDPKNTITLSTLAYAAFKQNDLSTALGFYGKILDLAPLDKNALYNTGVILQLQGKLQDALDTFRKLYEIGADITLLPTIGLLSIKLDDYPTGIRYLEAYREQKGDDLDVVVALGHAYVHEKQYDRALSAFDSALKLKPANAAVLFDKASILLTAIGEETDGLTTLQAALDAGFSDADRAKQLADDADLVNAEKVRALLRDRKLLAPASEPSSTAPSAGSGK